MLIPSRRIYTFNPGLTVFTAGLGGAGCVLPTIAGLQLWLKADAGTYQDAAMTVPAVLDTDPIGGWRDQSGNGNHFTQTVGANIPTLKLTIINGLPVVRFNVDGLVGPVMLPGNTPDSLSIFAVIKPINIWHGGNQSRIFNQVGNAGNQNIAFFYDSSAKLIQDVYPPSGGFLLSSINVTTNAQLVSTSRGAGTQNLYINGTNRGTQVGAESYTGIPVVASHIGMVFNMHYLDGDIAEIIIYNSALSDPNRQAAENYLNCRYAIW